MPTTRMQQTILPRPVRSLPRRQAAIPFSRSRRSLDISPVRASPASISPSIIPSLESELRKKADQLNGRNNNILSPRKRIPWTRDHWSKRTATRTISNSLSKSFKPFSPSKFYGTSSTFTVTKPPCKRPSTPPSEQVRSTRRKVDLTSPPQSPTKMSDDFLPPCTRSQSQVLHLPVNVRKVLLSGSVPPPTAKNTPEKPKPNTTTNKKLPNGSSVPQTREQRLKMTMTTRSGSSSQGRSATRTLANSRRRSPSPCLSPVLNTRPGSKTRTGSLGQFYHKGSHILEEESSPILTPYNIDLYTSDESEESEPEVPVPAESKDRSGMDSSTEEESSQTESASDDESSDSSPAPVTMKSPPPRIPKKPTKPGSPRYIFSKTPPPKMKKEERRNYITRQSSRISTRSDTQSPAVWSMLRILNNKMDYSAARRSPRPLSPIEISSSSDDCSSDSTVIMSPIASPEMEDQPPPANPKAKSPFKSYVRTRSALNAPPPPGDSSSDTEEEEEDDEPTPVKPHRTSPIATRSRSSSSFKSHFKCLNMKRPLSPMLGRPTRPSISQSVKTTNDKVLSETPIHVESPEKLTTTIEIVLEDGTTREWTESTELTSTIEPALTGQSSTTNCDASQLNTQQTELPDKPQIVTIDSDSDTIEDDSDNATEIDTNSEPETELEVEIRHSTPPPPPVRTLRSTRTVDMSFEEAFPETTIKSAFECIDERVKALYKERENMKKSKRITIFADDLNNNLSALDASDDSTQDDEFVSFDSDEEKINSDNSDYQSCASFMTATSTLSPTTSPPPPQDKDIDLPQIDNDIAQLLDKTLVSLLDQTIVPSPLDQTIVPQPIDQEIVTQPIDEAIVPPLIDKAIEPTPTEPAKSPPPKEKQIELSTRTLRSTTALAKRRELLKNADPMDEVRRRLAARRNFANRYYTQNETPYEVTCTDVFKAIEKDEDCLYATAFNEFADPKGGGLNQFAVAGTGGASVYKLGKSGQIVWGQRLVTRDDILYSCTWSYNTFKDKGTEPFIICGGERGILYVANMRTGENFHFSANQGGPVNEIRVDPKKPQLIFSAHADGAIRLWNTRSRHLVAVFFGWNGHKEQVITLDVHHKYNYLVSAGMDNAILIWDYGIPRLDEQLRRSDLPIYGGLRNLLHTQEVHLPVWQNHKVHSHYVDTVRWWHNYVLTRSVDGTLKIWKPTDVKLNGDLSYVCRKLTARDDTNAKLRDPPRNFVDFINFPVGEQSLFWLRCSLSHDIKHLTFGDDKGNLWMYKICRETWQEIKCHKYKVPQEYEGVVRQVSYNRTATALISVQDGGIVRVHSIRHKTPKEGPLSVAGVSANQKQRIVAAMMAQKARHVMVKKPSYDNHQMEMMIIDDSESSLSSLSSTSSTSSTSMEDVEDEENKDDEEDVVVVMDEEDEDEDEENVLSSAFEKKTSLETLNPPQISTQLPIADSKRTTSIECPTTDKTCDNQTPVVEKGILVNGLSQDNEECDQNKAASVSQQLESAPPYRTRNSTKLLTVNGHAESKQQTQAITNGHDRVEDDPMDGSSSDKTPNECCLMNGHVPDKQLENSKAHTLNCPQEDEAMDVTSNDKTTAPSIVSNCLSNGHISNELDKELQNGHVPTEREVFITIDDDSSKSSKPQVRLSPRITRNRLATEEQTKSSGVQSKPITNGHTQNGQETTDLSEGSSTNKNPVRFSPRITRSGLMSPVEPTTNGDVHNKPMTNGHMPNGQETVESIDGSSKTKAPLRFSPRITRNSQVTDEPTTNGQVQCKPTQNGHSLNEREALEPTETSLTSKTQVRYFTRQSRIENVQEEQIPNVKEKQVPINDTSNEQSHCDPTNVSSPSKDKTVPNKVAPMNSLSSGYLTNGTDKDHELLNGNLPNGHESIEAIDDSSKSKAQARYNTRQSRSEQTQGEQTPSAQGEKQVPINNTPNEQNKCDPTNGPSSKNKTASNKVPMSDISNGHVPNGIDKDHEHLKSNTPNGQEIIESPGSKNKSPGPFSPRITRNRPVPDEQSKPVANGHVPTEREVFVTIDDSSKSKPQTRFSPRITRNRHASEGPTMNGHVETNSAMNGHTPNGLETVDTNEASITNNKIPMRYSTRSARNVNTIEGQTPNEHEEASKGKAPATKVPLSSLSNGHTPNGLDQELPNRNTPNGHEVTLDSIDVASKGKAAMRCSPRLTRSGHATDEQSKPVTNGHVSNEFTKELPNGHVPTESEVFITIDDSSKSKPQMRFSPRITRNRHASEEVTVNGQVESKLVMNGHEAPTEQGTTVDSLDTSAKSKPSLRYTTRTTRSGHTPVEQASPNGHDQSKQVADGDKSSERMIGGDSVEVSTKSKPPIVFSPRATRSGHTPVEQAANVKSKKVQNEKTPTEPQETTKSTKGPTTSKTQSRYNTRQSRNIINGYASNGDLSSDDTDEETIQKADPEPMIVNEATTNKDSPMEEDIPQSKANHGPEEEGKEEAGLSGEEPQGEIPEGEQAQTDTTNDAEAAADCKPRTGEIYPSIDNRVVKMDRPLKSRCTIS